MPPMKRLAGKTMEHDIARARVYLKPGGAGATSLVVPAIGGDYNSTADIVFGGSHAYDGGLSSRGISFNKGYGDGEFQDWNTSYGMFIIPAATFNVYPIMRTQKGNRAGTGTYSLTVEIYHETGVASGDGYFSGTKEGIVPVSSTRARLITDWDSETWTDFTVGNIATIFMNSSSSSYEGYIWNLGWLLTW